MNREDRIANKIAKTMTAGYSASEYYKSLAGWTTIIRKKARRVDELAPIILDDLQMLLDSSNKNHVLYNLGYLAGALEELAKNALDMHSVVIDATKDVHKNAS